MNARHAFIATGAIGIVALAACKAPVGGSVDPATFSAITLSVAAPSCKVAAIGDTFSVPYEVDSDADLVLEVYAPKQDARTVLRKTVSAGESGTLTVPANTFGAGTNSVVVWAYGKARISALARFELDARAGTPGAPTIDTDGDCYSARTGDCDDSAAAIHPGVVEICNDTIDNDCDGVVDFADKRCAALCDDSDRDGFTSTTCGGKDCDDNDAETNPAQPELCDGLDNNCDGQRDESFDRDGDGFVACAGVSVVRRTDGTSCPVGFVTCEDCDDQDASTFPGAFEPCDDKLHACKGSLADKQKDEDGDGFRNCEDPDSDNDAVCDPGAALNLMILPCAPATASDGRCCAPASADNCPLARNHLQTDLDADGQGDACDPCSDEDGDGYGQGGAYSRNGALSAIGAAVGHPLGDPQLDDTSFDQQGCPGQPVNAANRSDADCDDAATDVFPGRLEDCDGKDNDCDGSFDEDFDQDGDGYTTCTGTTLKKSDGTTPPLTARANDCDDSPLRCGAACSPGAAEACDGFDNDCSCFVVGAIATCVDQTFDTDLDGYTQCTSTSGRLSTSQGGVNTAIGTLAPIQQDDCADGANARTPGLSETCDGLDNDCDTLVDDGNFDVDDDGYTSCGSGRGCATRNPDDTCASAKTPFTVINVSLADLDDSDAARFPGHAEICDGKDNDFSGGADDDPAIDADDDGYNACGSGRGLAQPISAPAGPFEDCDEARNDVHPAHAELCDNRDNDCDGDTDEDFDLDADGYFDCPGATWTRFGPCGPTGVTCRDCQDCAGDNCVAPNVRGDAVHPGRVGVPGSAAIEVCNGVDDDCDGAFDELFDADNDGFTTCSDVTGRLSTGAATTLGKDCQDCAGAGCAGPALSGGTIYPGATESCNGLDDNCDLVIDETFDLDGDGYTQCGSRAGNAAAFSTTLVPALADCKDCAGAGCVACETPGCVAAGLAGAAINPGQPELCDDFNNDCEGGVDEGCDDDNDDYCDTRMITRYSPPPRTCLSTTSVGLVDCEDCATAGCAFTGVTGAAIHPGLTEACDGYDNDCSCPYGEATGNALELGTWRGRPAAGFSRACVDDNDDDDTDGYTQCGLGKTNGAAGAQDCDDNAGTSNPGVPEICFNGTDDDCDGSRDEADGGCCASVASIPFRNAGDTANVAGPETFQSYALGFVPQLARDTTVPAATGSALAGGWESKDLHSDDFATTPTVFSDETFGYKEFNSWGIWDHNLGGTGPSGLGSKAAGTSGNDGDNNFSGGPPSSRGPFHTDSALISPRVNFGSVAPSGGAMYLVKYKRWAFKDPRGGPVAYTRYHNNCDKSADYGGVVGPSGFAGTCDASGQCIPPVPATASGIVTWYAPFLTQTGANERCDLCRDGEYFGIASWAAVTYPDDGLIGGTRPQAFFDWTFGSAAGTRDGGGNFIKAAVEPSFKMCPLTARAPELEQWKWMYADVTPAYNDIVNNRGGRARFMWRLNTTDDEDYQFTEIGRHDDGFYIDDVEFFVCYKP
ncbi:MAG: putative metal-binding motif-containing protein [Deltaproteobacteria bacterium]|nr:putative metal-binding motif-containing protein [Deltaproteobacteria bacterium]